MTTADAIVTARVPASTKQSATAGLAALGISMSQFINAMLDFAARHADDTDAITQQMRAMSQEQDLELAQRQKKAAALEACVLTTESLEARYGCNFAGVNWEDAAVEEERMRSMGAKYGMEW